MLSIVFYFVLISSFVFSLPLVLPYFALLFLVFSSHNIPCFPEIYRTDHAGEEAETEAMLSLP
jgi:hypothetical protein